ncbi:MAG: hypothetical protein U0930_24325 [Pirellulales bacterium]
MNRPNNLCWLKCCSSLATFFLAVLLVSGNCLAQMERYELGKRLRRFEQAWQLAIEEQRKPSGAIMQEAVRNFFSLNLLGAAQKLDDAYFAVNDQPATSWLRAVATYRVRTSKRMLDEKADTVSVSLDRFYKTNFAIAPDLTVNWEVSDLNGKSILSRGATWAESLEGVDLNVKELRPGDYWLRGTVQREDKTFALPEMLLSRIDELDATLSKLEEASRSEKSQLDATVRATIKDHLALLKSIQNGTTPESDFPAFRIVTSDLKLMSSNEGSVGQLIAQYATEADQWITLTSGKRKVPVRLRAPQNQSTHKMPVLFLFHGAGGSENMFFETYGAGQAVTEGLNRGWLVVASRQSLMGLGLTCQEMLADLERFFDIDRNQVYLIGHSMGAAQVIRQATLLPDLPRAAAVIGGGSASRDGKLLSKIAWYVAAGQLDFGKSGAAGFYQSLKKAEVPKAKYEEFADIEHMVIVQAALPNVFKFFDNASSVPRAAQ